MYCKNCGKEISDTAAFCLYCGEKTTPKAAPKTTSKPDKKKWKINDLLFVEGGDADGGIPVCERENRKALIVGALPMLWFFLSVILFLMSVVS